MRILNIFSKAGVLFVIWASILVTPIFGSLKYLYITSVKEVFEPLKFALSLGEKSSIFLFLLLAVSILAWVWKYSRGKKMRKLELHAVGITAIVSFVGIMYLMNLEAKNYHNFLYSTYGLKIPLLSNILEAGLILSFLYFCAPDFSRKLKIKSTDTSPVNLFGKLGWFNSLIIIGGLTILGWHSAFTFINLPGYSNYASQDYDQRFELFEYIEALRIKTPKNANIVLPPQSNSIWPALGNPPVVRYFLYPRILVSANVLDQKTFNEIGRVYFVEVNEALRSKYWPGISLHDKTLTMGENKVLTFSKIKLFSEDKGIKIFYIEP